MKNIKKQNLKLKDDIKTTRAGEEVALGFSNISKKYYIKYGNLKRLYISYDTAYSKFCSLN